MAKPKQRKFRPLFRVSGLEEKGGNITVTGELIPIYTSGISSSDDEGASLSSQLKEIYAKNKHSLLNKTGLAIKNLAISVWSEQGDEKGEKKATSLKKKLKFYLISEQPVYDKEYVLLQVIIVLKPTISPVFKDEFSYQSIVFTESLEGDREHK
jgi:hypothetical protein